MAQEPLQDREPDTVATPEGDNEFAPDEPLGEIAEGQQVARGGAAISYDSDKPKAEGELHGFLEVIDELSRGRMQT